MNRLLIAVLVLLPLHAYADSSPDESFYESFYKSAAEAGISEVDLGHMALKRSVNPAVKTFGALMIKDHTVSSRKLRAIAAAGNIKLPTTAGVSQGATKAKLSLATGTEFDQAYIVAMIAEHQEDVAAFRKEAESGQDPQAKAFAARTLPVLESHLRKIEEIARTNGVTA